jgi:hypothetical protein
MAEAEIPSGLRKIALRLDYVRQMQRFPRASAAAGLALLGARSYLRDAGWFRSFASRLAVDADGAPLPWFTYAAIALLEPRVGPDLRVFEYGAGHSTLWWAARVREVRSVEDDAGWIAALQPRLPPNARINHAAVDDVAYAGGAALAAGAGGAPDELVVKEGPVPNACVPAALEALSDRGVIVWDNSERPRYTEGQQRLREAGFRRVDLHGMGPINPYGWCTSVFYRDGNCLCV